MNFTISTLFRAIRFRENYAEDMSKTRIALQIFLGDNLPYRLLFTVVLFSSTMREVISLHVGQAGVQIGNACC